MTKMKMAFNLKTIDPSDCDLHEPFLVIEDIQNLLCFRFDILRTKNSKGNFQKRKQFVKMNISMFVAHKLIAR